MNSQECLFGPEGVIVDKGYGTMMGKESIKDLLKQVACSVGIEHLPWQ